MMALEEKTNPERLKTVAKLCGRQLSPAESVVFRSSNRRYTWHFTCKGFCDCGTVIGSFNDAKRSLTEAEISRKVRKWKRKGWGEAKVNRALSSIREDQRLKAESLALAIAEKKERSAPAGDSWMAFVRGCNEELDGESFYLLLRWAGGSRRIGVAEEVATPIADLKALDLMYWKEDVAYRCQ
jgi:hypothetical protein